MVVLGAVAPALADLGSALPRHDSDVKAIEAPTTMEVQPTPLHDSEDTGHTLPAVVRFGFASREMESPSSPPRPPIVERLTEALDIEPDSSEGRLETAAIEAGESGNTKPQEPPKLSPNNSNDNANNNTSQDDGSAVKSDDAPGADEKPKRKPAIPTARRVNFEGFKNRFAEDEGLHVLDVLYVDDNFVNEVRRELQIRRAKDRSKKGGAGKAQKASVQPKEGSWIQRVRIQSRPVLAHLAKTVGETWSTSMPRVFHRPFAVIIYFHDKMKEALVELESKWAGEERRQAAQGEQSPDAQGEHDADKTAKDGDEQSKIVARSDDDESQEAITDSVEALRDMRCYVEFVEHNILPLSRQFIGTTRRTIRFDDLWLLFNVGDLVWASEVMLSVESGARTDNMYQPLWRIYSITRPRQPFEYPKLDPKSKKPQQVSTDDEDEDEDEDAAHSSQFRVWAYYIDHDGVSYGAVKHFFAVDRYQGERQIASLPCYPMRFSEDWESHLAELQQQGRKFVDCLENDHQTYAGWTLVSQPNGDVLETKPGSFHKARQLSPEYIESHVIVDLAEVFHDVPDWKPTFHRPTIYSDAWGSSQDDFPIRTWSDDERSKLVSESSDELEQVADGVTMWQRRDGFQKNRFLRAIAQLGSAARKEKLTATSKILEDDDYALLPRRLFAYVLKERKFVCVDVQHLGPVKPQVNVFDNLKIEKDYKQMVKGLVSSHFVKKKLEQAQLEAAHRASLSQDIIHGKGRGLVILLHGVPGVGKTATAEAVALEYRKPLFAITCGDLGLTPKDVEESLTEIFRLAHKWNCVLLFDEADVFLAQRSRFDLKRNALVSVFLRILEYYNGLLFLTTNRVGTLDEAFKSRIHMSLYYPPLNAKQFKRIFEMNINRLSEMEIERHRLTGEPRLDIRVAPIKAFAKEHCEKTEKTGCDGRWNGRQIRNAFQIASSLARYYTLLEAEKRRAENGHMDLLPETPVLDDTQFRKVERATEAFRDYLRNTKGFNDADLAFLNGERDDTFRQEVGLLDMAAAEVRGYYVSGQQQHQQHQQQQYGLPGPGQQQQYPNWYSPAPGAQFLALQSGPVTYGGAGGTPGEGPGGTTPYTPTHYRSNANNLKGGNHSNNNNPPPFSTPPGSDGLTGRPGRHPPMQDPFAASAAPGHQAYGAAGPTTGSSAAEHQRSLALQQPQQNSFDDSDDSD